MNIGCCHLAALPYLWRVVRVRAPVGGCVDALQLVEVGTTMLTFVY